MTFADFAGLSTEQKNDAIWEWGFYLGKCSGTEENRILYSLNGYFAEMSMDVLSGQVTGIRPVKELDASKVAEYALSKDNPFVLAADLQH